MNYPPEIWQQTPPKSYWWFHYERIVFQASIFTGMPSWIGERCWCPYIYFDLGGTDLTFYFSFIYMSYLEISLYLKHMFTYIYISCLFLIYVYIYFFQRNSWTSLWHLIVICLKISLILLNGHFNLPSQLVPDSFLQFYHHCLPGCIFQYLSLGRFWHRQKAWFLYPMFGSVIK